MITHMVAHWVKPDQLQRARELFDHNGRVVQTATGFISRQILQSRADPLKWVAVNTWESEEALQNWMAHPQHILDSFGNPLQGPADSEYIRKYAQAGDFDSRPAESDRFEVMPNP